METLFLIFLMGLFLIGFAFVLKDYYREKNAQECKSNDEPENKYAKTNPPFISTVREKIYIIAIAILLVIVLFVSFLSNFLLSRCSALQKENENLNQKIVELEKTPSDNNASTTSYFDEEMEKTIDFLGQLLELYEKLE